MNYEAHLELIEYFKTNITKIELWFNVIQPEDQSISVLKNQMQELCNKRWEDR